MIDTTGKQNICLTVAYDGTDFHGFQRQTNASSIQWYLEQALAKIFNSRITIYGAARTDAGVHDLLRFREYSGRLLIVAGIVVIVYGAIWWYYRRREAFDAETDTYATIAEKIENAPSNHVLSNRFAEP